MKSEINDYKITNLDGISGHHPSYQIRIDNEKPSYIKENSLSSQNENFTEKETFNLEKKTQANNSAKSNNQSSNVSSAGSSSGSSAVSSASSSVAQAASTTSSLSGLSAVVGGVASSVAAAVMVVVAFVSIMVINISLVMASTNSLIFKLDIQNAQEEDFANPVIAVLEGKDGYYFEQEVFADTVYLTFDELESGSEYTLIVKNDEKIFAQKTYFTATKETQKGSLRVDAKYNRVVASVSCEQLKSGEYFTLTATDDSGKVVYRAEGVEQQKTFSFEVNDVYMLSLTLSVNGKVCDFKQLEIEYLKENEPIITPSDEPIYEPEYDYKNGEWEWADDNSTAWVTFPEINDGEPLVCEAEVASSETPATCEVDGRIVYIANVYVEEIDETISDEKVEEIEAIGHDYGEPVFEWTQNGNDRPTATATFTCRHDSQHIEVVQAEISTDYSSSQMLQYIATVEFEGETYTDTFIPEEQVIDEPTEEPESVEISLNEGQVYISASGYARQESGLSNPVEYVSSATNPYLIQEQEIYNCDNIINVYQTDPNIQTTDIYIKLKNVTIKAGSWCSLFRIVARNTLNIHLIIEGKVSFVGGSGQQVFSSQGSYSPSVTIIIDETSAGGTFDVETPDGLTYAESGSINVRYI